VSPKSPAEAQSPNFSDSDGNQASSDITFDATPAQVQDEFAVFRESQCPSCLQTALDAYITYELQHPSGSNGTVPQGVTVGKSSVAQMSFPSFGDQSIAFRLTIPISADGLNIDGYFDVVAIQQTRVAVSLQFFGVGAPFDANMEEQLTTLTVQRVASSLASS